MRHHTRRRSSRLRRQKRRGVKSRRGGLNGGGGGQPTEPTNTAVIVEFRKTDGLPFVVRNALENLDDSWNILIFHGRLNADWVKEMIDRDFQASKHRIQTKALDHDNMTAKEYSDMLRTKEFYEKIPTENMLIFQIDSLICSPHKDLLKNFMEYDYVGAPWLDGGVGNGGFSLRKKSKMIQFLEQCPLNDKVEDVYFGGICEKFSLNKPPFEKAKEFSVETVYNPKSFGMHKPWGALGHKMEELEAQCPGIKKVKELYEATR